MLSPKNHDITLKNAILSGFDNVPFCLKNAQNLSPTTNNNSNKLRQQQQITTTTNKQHQKQRQAATI